MKVDVASRTRAMEAYEANLAPRSRRLATLERYAFGDQYEGRASFWDDDVPLRERAPCIVVPLPERAADSNVDLCLGEGRAPTFSFHESDPDDVADASFGLSEDDAALLTRFLCACCEQTDAITAFQDALFWAQIHGATCGVVRAYAGRLCIDIEDAKWCTPKFSTSDPDEVESLEIRYPYLEEYKQDDGTLSWKCKLFRRVIDAQRDVTYKPADADKHGIEPRWQEGEAVEHGLGFCPVRWFRFARSAQRRDIDGTALHGRVLDELDAYNLALSQVHRAAITSTDPQVYELGVDADHNPAPMGRVSSAFIANAEAMGLPRDAEANRNWTIFGPNGAPVRSGAPARKRGPGVVLRYPDAQSKVGMLTLPGDALTPAANNAKTILATLKEALGVVFIDPEQTKLGSDISGRALEWLHSKQIDRCNMVRKRFGRGFILPMISTMLRLALKAQGDLFLAGLGKARKTLARFERPADNGQRWFSPEPRIAWGAYFAATAADAKADVETALAAKDGGVITQHTAVEKIRPHFPDIKDVDTYLESLEEEAEKKAAKFHDAAAALMAPQEDAEGEETGEEPVAVPPKPKAKPVPFTREPKPKKPPVVRKGKRVRAQEEMAA